MAKETQDGLHVGGGVAVDFVELTEGDFAAGAGAAYAPPERGRFRRIAGAREIQLLQDAPGVVRTTQTTAATVRLPSGVTATNDAGDGRQVKVFNGGTGIITVQDSVGTVITTIRVNLEAVLLHETNNTWRVSEDFGNQFQSAVSEGESTTTSSTFQTKVTLTTNNLPIGTYILTWSCQGTNGNNNREFRSRVRNTTDGIDVASETIVEIPNANDYQPCAGMAILSALSGVKSFEIQFSVDTGGTAKIREARLALWRVI